jgi:hypothetical protein
LAEIAPEKGGDRSAEEAGCQADAYRHEGTELGRSPQGHDDQAGTENKSGGEGRQVAKNLD